MPDSMQAGDVLVRPLPSRRPARRDRRWAILARPRPRPAPTGRGAPARRPVTSAPSASSRPRAPPVRSPTVACCGCSTPTPRTVAATSSTSGATASPSTSCWPAKDRWHPGGPRGWSPRWPTASPRRTPPGLAHGRLTPENVLIDQHGQVRIIGFGVDAALSGLPAGSHQRRRDRPAGPALLRAHREVGRGSRPRRCRPRPRTTARCCVRAGSAPGSRDCSTPSATRSSIPTAATPTTCPRAGSRDLLHELRRRPDRNPGRRPAVPAHTAGLPPSPSPRSSPGPRPAHQASAVGG